jgi:LysM repeat protein
MALALVLVAAGIGAFGALAQDGGTASYTVEPGDILDTIAAGFDVQTSCLAEMNDLTRPDRIKSGDVLLISYDCPPYDGANFVTNPRDGSSDLGQGGGGDGTAAPQIGPNDQSYTVARGDMLDSIAQQFDVSLQDLMRANGMSSFNTDIFVGQILVIPGDATPYGTFPGVADPLNPLDTTSGQGGGGPEVQAGDELYVVQPRDVLDLIGAAYDVQVGCLSEANGISYPHRIYPGQTLVVRMSCPAYDGEAFVENPRSS